MNGLKYVPLKTFDESNVDGDGDGDGDVEKQNIELGNLYVGESIDNCSICLEPIDYKSLCLKCGCKNKFHKDCIVCKCYYHCHKLCRYHHQ